MEKFIKKSATVVLTMLMFFTVIIVPREEVNAASKTKSDFVNTLYEVCLNRSASSAEINYWCERLIYSDASGCSITYDFVFSNEYQANNISDSEFLDDMYQVFFGRAADTTGKNYWLSKLRTGTTRRAVYGSFANSNEFTIICKDYSILRGVFIDGYDNYQLNKVCVFAENMYKVVLERNADITGLKYWVGKLISRSVSGKDVAQNFLSSDEYVNKHKNNVEYISDLYGVFLGRRPIGDEASSWATFLNNGGSREQLIYSFASSPEFYMNCRQLGINSGVPVTGFVNDDGTEYYYLNGVRHTGWVDFNGARYYVSNGLKLTSWQTIGGKWYFFNNSGVMQTGWLTRGDYKFYLDTDGTMITGWKKLDGHWYYFDLDTGRMCTGWKKIDGKWYFFSNSTISSYTGMMQIGWLTYQNNQYYFADNGAMVTGWRKIDGYWYYFDPDTGKRLYGWQDINGERYYLNDNFGYETGLKDIDGKKYYFDESGRLYRGTTGELVIFDNFLFIVNADYSLTKASTGWYEIDGKYYYATAPGILIGLFRFDDCYYYFDSTGAMQTGWVKIDGEWYYFKDNGKSYSGWVDYNGNTYYIEANGRMRYDKFFSENGNMYYVRPNGIVARDMDVDESSRGYENDVAGTFVNHYHAGPDGVLVMMGNTEFIPD